MAAITDVCAWCGAEVTWDSFARCWRDSDDKYRCRGSVIWHSPHQQSEPAPGTQAPPGTHPPGVEDGARRD